MAKFLRTDRVSELIRREMADIITNDLRDERIGMASVSGVKVTRDLKEATVYITVLGDEHETEVSLKALNKASSFVRARLYERVDLRYIPVIKFIYDNSIVNGMQMDKILNDIKELQ